MKTEDFISILESNGYGISREEENINGWILDRTGKNIAHVYAIVTDSASVSLRSMDLGKVGIPHGAISVRVADIEFESVSRFEGFGQHGCEVLDFRYSTTSEFAMTALRLFNPIIPAKTEPQ